MILGLFDGIGGWTEGLALVDPDLARTVVGVERGPWATRTAQAAGHATIRADVEHLPLDHLAGHVDGVTASPPCQAFSSAGKREGRDWVPLLIEAAAEGRTLPEAPERVRLVLEPTRWVQTLRPRWLAMEQVPVVLPIWEAYWAWLDQLGYSTWAGVLNAADYGVPQTRKRAILLASLDRPVGCPPPTHAESPVASLFGPAPEAWVSMAEALGWTGELDRRQQTRGVPARAIPTDERAPTLTGIAGAKSQWVVRTGQNTSGLTDRYERVMDRPAPTVTSKADEWAWRNPAPTVSGGGVEGGGGVEVFADARRKIAESWPYGRPATTLTGDSRVFGPHSGSAGEPHSSNATSVTPAEALVLQSFRPDYPVQGPKGATFLQIGNAIPARLAAHCLAAVTGLPIDLTDQPATTAGPSPCPTGA